MKSVVRVNNFTGKNGEVTPDKNNNNPVYLTYISGSSIPQRARVLSGTIAKNLGLEVGKSYLVDTQETGEDPEYGTQYSTTVVAEMAASDLIALFSSEVKQSVKQVVTEKENVPAGARA